MKKYDKVTQDFAKFFDSDVLSKVLEAKVDVLHLEKVFKTKVSTDDFDHLIYVQELLDKKIQHISMIQVELTKSLIPATN